MDQQGDDRGRRGGKRGDGGKPRRGGGQPGDGGKPRDRDAGRGGPRGAQPGEQRQERGTPAGIDRARAAGKKPPLPLRRAGAPASTPEPPEPEWPAQVQVDLPRGVKHELRNQVRGGKELVERVTQALSVAADHIDGGDPEAAVGFLEWAKHHAPRSSAIREALGVARYLVEDFAGAVTELQAYRRMTGHQDQNHLLADCQRALDRDTARIGALVEAMDPGRDGEDRYVEGVIVWASALADAGDVGAGRAVLRRVIDESRTGQPEAHDLRLWYVAADLAERDGDRDAAGQWFRRIAVHADGYFDVDERLEALQG